jgi:Kef-type K+ transport system membrane component KefB
MHESLPIEDPVLIFALVASLILLAPILLGRYRLPGMVGLLLAGAVLGPNATGVLARDQSFVLFGTVGLLYIMFMAALEIDLAVFKRTRVHSIVFGLLTFIIPQGVGTLVAHYLLGFEWMAAILLASLFASHTLLAYPIASRLGIAKGQAVTTAVGGTILTDTLALLVLAVVAGSARGQVDDTFWYRLAATISVYVLAILVGLPLLGRWFFRNIPREGVSEFAFVLAAVFGTASLSHAAGVEPIIGAFLAGLALNRLIPHSSTLMNRLEFTGNAIFVPFFLLSVGMLLDVRIFLGGVRSWVISGGMLASVLVTKWLAANLARLFLGYDRNETGVIFGLTVAQAAATLAVTMVGFEIGLFDDTVVNGAILMIIVTCIVAPLVVDRYGRDLAEALQEAEEEDKGPTQRVLVALANPTTAPPLLELAQVLRDPAQEQPVYPLAVVEEGKAETSEDHVMEAEKLLSGAVFQLTAADIPTHPLTRIDISVPSGILRARRELRGTDVIVGWAGPSSTAELFFGSVVERLLADASYTLVVGRLPESFHASKRLLFVVPPHADQECSFPTAARVAKRLAKQLGAKLVVVALETHAKRVAARMGKVKPTVEVHMNPLRSGAGLAKAVANMVEPGDFVVLQGLRPAAAAWRPRHANLPARLARRLPEKNLAVVYPSNPEEEDAQDVRPLRAGTPPGPPPPDRVVMDVSAESLDGAVRALLPYVQGLDEASAKRIAKRLVDDVQELTPGVVLVHAESKLVRKHAVVLGVSRNGVPHDALQAPAHLFVLLVDPPGRDPSRHLRHVAATALAFHTPDVVEQARTAANAEELLIRLGYPPSAPSDAREVA